jgi:Uncharacterised protein family UPF0102
MARHSRPRRRSRSRGGKCAKRVLKKIATFSLGISAESRAAAWLLAHGYRILARRWKSPLGEIDIIDSMNCAMPPANWPNNSASSPRTDFFQSSTTLAICLLNLRMPSA